MTVEVIILQGNVGQNSGLKEVGETQICNLTLAVKVYGSEEPRWHDIVVFGKLAEIAAKYCEKGREITVAGRTQKRPYEKDGTTRYSFEVVADNIYLDTMDLVVARGRVGSNDGLRQAGETEVCNFSLAVDRRKNDEVEWYRCVVFGKSAKVAAEHGGKGRMVTVIGHMRTRSYDKDGVTQYRTELIVDQYKLGRKPKDKDSEAGDTNNAGHDAQTSTPEPTPAATAAPVTAEEPDDFDF